MEQKLIRVPFEVELAKRISNGNEEGRIVTRGGYEARIVCWDYKSMSGDYPILALINQGKQEAPIPYSKEGRYNVYGYFSEDCLDLMLEIPEYMTFKDGDVYTTSKGSIGIYNSNYNTLCNYIPFYVGMRNDGELIFRKKDDYAGFGSKTESVLSTESEKQKLINALKASKEPKAKECLKILGIKQKQEYEFKPFDKVLVRCSNESQWGARFFDRMFEAIMLAQIP